MSININRVITIIEWLIPNLYRDIQIFLSFINFYRKFIAGYFLIIALLTDIFKSIEKRQKLKPFFLIKEAKNIFNKLK